MSKIKAKLTAVLMTACCALGCLGIGFAFAKQTTKVTANAATAEELTAEFTNNGQFTLAQSSKTIPSSGKAAYTVLEGSAAQSTLPDGYSGSVLEIYHSSSGSYDFVTVDFSNSKIPVKDVVSIVVRVWVDNYNYTDDSTDNDDEFRTIGAVTGTQRQYGIGKLNVEGTWTDVALTAGSITDMTDADGYLNAIDLGIRDKGEASHLYIDSVTVNTYQDINLGKVALYGNSLSAPATNRLYLAKADGTGMGAELKDVDFKYESGTGFNVNGTQFGMKIRQRDKRFFCYYPEDNTDIKTLLTDETKPDTITVGGTYINKEKGIRYIIEDTTFIWNGTVWEPKYTTYNVGDVKFKQIGAEGKHIYFSPVSTANFDTTTWNSGWNAVFSWKDGVGVTINGETVSDAKVKFPGSFFIEFATAPQVGDILCVGGTYYNASVAKEYKINEAELKYNGTAWETVIDEPEVQYTITEVGTLKVHGHSASTTTNKPSATALYMKSSVTLPFTTWDDKFNLESGDGFKLNGNNVTTGQLVSADKNLYVNLSSAGVQVGDVLSVSGTFVHVTELAKYVIEESKFVWDGVAWENYEDYTKEYTTQEVGSLKFSSWTAGNNQIYLARADGGGFTIPADNNSGWTAVFRAKLGVGVTLNGKLLKNLGNQIKFPGGNMFINIKGAFADGEGPVEGDVLVVGGTFYNIDLASQYVVTETTFMWNGTTWEKVINYSTYTVTKLGMANNSNASELYLYSLAGDKLPKDKGDWNSVYAYGEGASVKLNDEAISPEVKLPGDLYIPLGKDAQVGDCFTINGTFYNEAKEVKLVFDNCKLYWDGTAWVDSYEPPVVEYAITELGALKVNGNSTGATTNKPSATQLYLSSTTTLPFKAWSDKFTLESGDGWKLNGTAFTPNEFISADGNLFVNIADANVQKGDVLSVSGTFVHATALAKYVIEESKFVWNGTAWEDSVEYATYTFSGLNFSSWNATDNHLYLTPVGEWEKPVDGNNGWTAPFFNKDGAGVMFGETKIKYTSVKFPGSMFINLGKAPAEGEKVTIAGTFYNTDCAVQYVIPETTFMWNGTTWEKVINYTTIELGSLTFDKVESENKFVYLNPTSGEIPSDAAWNTYTCIDGAGVKMNDVAVGATVKFPSQCFIEFASAPNLGDKLTISGTFANVETALKFVISETTLYWDGTAWVTEPPVMYTVHTLGALKFQKVDAENKYVYLVTANGAAIADSDMAIFTLESGAGVMINDEEAAATVKFPGAVVIELSGAPAQGDKLVISGTFYNEELMVKYVVPETTLYWDSMEWVEVDSSAYEVHELGEMLVASPSATVAGGARATQLYLKKADGNALPFPDADWNTEFAYQSGIGVLLNGEWITIIDLESTNSGLFLQLNNAGVKVGDVLTIGGTYKSADVSAKYVITESSFMWNGSFWVNYVTNNRLEAYDIITIQDIGLGEELTMEGTVSEVTHSFAPSVGNTTKSVVVRFGYNCADTALAGANLRFRLRGSQWQGITFDLRDGRIYIQHLEGTQRYAFESNTDYVIEIGAISMKDGRLWTYVSVNEAMVLSAMMVDSQFATADYFKDYETTGFTNHISIYATAVAKTTLTDPDGIKVTYVSSAGTHVEKVKKNDTYELAVGKGLKTFIGWAYDGVLYAPGTEVTVDKAMTFTAVEIDFTTQDGAAMRIGKTAEKSGIRFTSQFNKAEVDALLGQYGIESIDYGTLIIPYDYLAYNQKPNLEDFDPEKDEILKIESTPMEAVGGYVVFRGAMQKMYQENYGRLFAGRAYMEITFAGGEVWTIYTPFDNEANVRSIRIIAKAFKADTSEPADATILRYNSLTDVQKAVVDAYIGTEAIKLMNYDAYEANAMPIIAWNFPKLDPTNNYMNDANIAVANTMKEAGIKVIGLTGANILSMNSIVNIEQTRQIIDFFWSQGIGTFAFQNNGAGNLNNNFAQSGYPDFSDCEGFMGFLIWDEPTVESMDKMVTQIESFENAYAGTDVILMGNLLPSYASIFGGNTPDKAAYKAYLQKYCDVVLSKVSGTKWLSIDTYPILADKTLYKSFLYDIGTLKTVALANDAHAHVILQAYGFVESGNADKERMPSEAELRMQAYAAMAFGVDSMSWYVYSPNGHGECDTAVDVNGTVTNEEKYNAFKNINAELTAIGKVYNAFSWKGIILGAGKNNGASLGSWEITKDNDYKAFEMVMGQLGDYELSASDTKHLASVKTNKTDWNYLMGVMEDKNGNEGYVLCNYNSHESDRAQTITLTFDTNVTEVVIYRGGEAETVAVTGKTLTVNLATGEGVIILPSKAA